MMKLKAGTKYRIKNLQTINTMEKLTLKEIAGYLPYGLQVKSGNYTIRNLVIDTESYLSQEGNISLKSLLNGVGHKPLLHSLEMLTKTIVHNGVGIIPIDLLGGYVDWEDGIQFIEWWKIETLYELHFDIHGLIEKGLAIDKSKI